LAELGGVLVSKKNTEGVFAPHTFKNQDFQKIDAFLLNVEQP
jgi:hypothetical protein